MYEIQIPAHVYQQAAQAAEAHHMSLEDFVIEALTLHAQDEPETHDHVFTPQVIAELDAAAAEAREGNNIPLEEFKAQRPKWRQEWLL
jgi:uncharacterized protein (DUF1778 family)